MYVYMNIDSITVKRVLRISHRFVERILLLKIGKTCTYLYTCRAAYFIYSTFKTGIKIK